MSVGSRSIVLTFIFWTVCISAFTQVKVTSGFLYDSIQLGKRTGFYLSAKYPSTSVVLFPDSTASYSTFSYEGRQYFATESDQGVSNDSAVYYVKTFDISAVQKLELPVFVLNQGDCTKYLSNTDSISITRLSALVPDTISLSNLPLKIDTRYQNAARPLNMMVILLVLGSTLIIAGSVWMIFGQRINAYFASRKLQKQYREFVNAYSRTVEQLKTEFSPQLTESAVYTWKKYMEGLEARPYTKLTTTETIKLYGEDALGRDLRLADRAIYAQDSSGVSALDQLRLVADDRYQTKLKEVMHGK